MSVLSWKIILWHLSIAVIASLILIWVMANTNEGTTGSKFLDVIGSIIFVLVFILSPFSFLNPFLSNTYGTDIGIT